MQKMVITLTFLGESQQTFLDGDWVVLSCFGSHKALAYARARCGELGKSRRALKSVNRAPRFSSWQKRPLKDEAHM